MNWIWKEHALARDHGYWTVVFGPVAEPWKDVVVVLAHKKKPGWWISPVGVADDKFDLGPFEFEEAKQRAEIIGELNSFPMGFRGR